MGFLNSLEKFVQLKKKESKILFVGLEGSGKSTIINQIKSKKSRNCEVAPTVGFEVQKFAIQRMSVTVLDMSGQKDCRYLWKENIKDCDAIVFVLNSADSMQIAEAKEELNNFLRHKEISKNPNLPVLFLANKFDLRKSRSAIKCAQLLELDRGEWMRGGSPVVDTEDFQQTGRPWHICETNSLTGEGLEEGIQWLSHQLTKTPKTSFMQTDLNREIYYP